MIRDLLKELPSDACFVAFARPDETVLNFWQADNVQTGVTDGFVMAPFQGELLGIARTKATITQVDISLINADQKPNIKLEPQGEEDFCRLVSTGIDAIKEGQFAKVVLSRKEIHAVDLDIAGSFANLLTDYPNAFRYLWFTPQTGFWMGATPEVMVRATQNRFETMALAGTQLFGPHIFWAEKERQEQFFVTFFITESLRALANDLHVSEPYTATAGRLAHLRTDIKGKLKADASWRDVLNVLHPTPAVCGYPKFEALDFITAHEGYDRSFYSGYLGEISPDATDLYVNLRCMHYSGGNASLFIGGGITADSIPAQEYMETVNKSLTIKRILV